VQRMQETFGTRFRGGERITLAQLANVSGRAWPEIAATQAALPSGSSVFAYLYKIWRCGQLIGASGVAYDAVVRLRPDIRPTQPFRMARIPGSADLELQVGGRCTRIGPRAVAISAYTNFCGNDWMAIGGLEAMTVTMDLLRFWSPSSRFLSPDAAFDHLFSVGVEIAHNFLWWRTGTTVLRRPLFIELSRRRCTKPACLRMPAWQILPSLHPGENESRCTVLPPTERPPVGALQRGRYGLINDCGASSEGGVGDLEYFTGPTPTRPTPMSGYGNASISASLKRHRPQLHVEPPRVLKSSLQPSWARPDCGDVPDLSVHEPLPPCKKTTGDEASYRLGAHRPKVRNGYGAVLLFSRKEVRRKEVRRRAPIRS
jgi:hypothetical protein